MGSSSSSSTNMVPQKKYDVFLSFRGDDTRDNFTCHLYAAFCRKHIETFIDNQLIRGDEISQSLLNAIEESYISVIIFSERYASSGWCLDELAKILECKNKYGQVVIPVFYRVDPSDVRNQTGNFGDSFTKLEERFQGRLDKLQKWRIALREVANLSGFHSQVIRPDSELIDTIANDILKKMEHFFSSDSKDQLIGVESRILEIESLLNIGSKDVYKLGIWGIGGIGKTAIATAVFNKISSYFDGSCFIQNVREESEKVGGLAQLQWKLLSTLLEDESVKIDIHNSGLNFRRLSRKKVLIVFDDVTHFQQIESLIESLCCFGRGSRIIITTRDKHVLEVCRVDEIYKVNELVHDDALILFSQHAFGENDPDVGYEELSRKVIEYAQGVPLALKVLGCLLFKRSEEEWVSEIKKLKEIPHMDIQKVLKVSYVGLDDKEKNSFLDIACLLKGKNKDLVAEFLDANGFFAKIGIRILIDRCLISIRYNKITMHDLLQEMGREIVRQESVNNPGKRSRLFHHEDIYKVFTHNTVTEAIEGISLNMSELKESICLHPGTLTKMYNLRFLEFYSSVYEDNINKVHIQDMESSTMELRYLHWPGYPLKTLPIHPEKLVSLAMFDSKVEQLWDGVQDLVSLKKIGLSGSKQLTKLPDLSKARNLEYLYLSRCSSLVETHSSIQYLNKLVILDLNDCKSLTSLPKRIRSESLEDILVVGCSNLKSFPEISSCSIEVLHLEGTAFEELPSSIDSLSRLKFLYLIHCESFERLPSSLFNLDSLRRLQLSGCSNLKRLPEISSCNLEKLYLDESAVEELPPSIGRLSRLEFLNLKDCSRLERLPSNIFNLESLQSLILSGCSNLKRLPEISLIDCLSRLAKLNLKNCSRLESLPSSLCQLKTLANLKLSGCSNLQRLPDELGNLDALTKLKAKRTAIREVPSSIVCLKNLVTLHFKKLRVHEQMSFILPILLSSEGSQRLKYLKLTDCSITELPESLGQLSSLEKLYLDKNNFGKIPESIINLSKLKRLHLSYCERLQSLPNLPCNLQYMDASHCSSLQTLSGLSTLFTIQTTFVHDQIFYLGNCLKLEPNELKKIVDNALQKIQLIATAWSRKPHWVDSVDKICYPGSEIPEWLKNQSMGSSITLELPPGDQIQRFNNVGFAFCVIVAFEDHHQSDQDFDVYCELKVKTEDGECHGVYDFFIQTIDYVEADHVILGYELSSKFVHDIFRYPKNKEAFFEFSLDDNTTGKQMECCPVVKKCGIHLLCLQDFGESKKDGSRSFEEEEP